MKEFKNVNDGRILTEAKIVAMYLREFKANKVTKKDYSECKTLEELTDKIAKNKDSAAESWVCNDRDFELVSDEEENDEE